MWKCIVDSSWASDESNGTEVKVGDEVTSFRGEKAKVLAFYPPKHGGSSGHIETTIGCHYPQVYNCKFKKEETNNA
jgi:hypothetical protein